MAYRIKNRKSQVWSIDYIIGLLIFIVIVLISIRLILNITSDNDDAALYKDAVHLSDILMNPGSPPNWDVANVTIPGLTYANASSKLDLNKIILLDSIGYDRTKVLFHISHDYLYFFENKTGAINIAGCSHGYTVGYIDCKPDISNIDFDDLVKINRIITYNSTLITLTIYVWS